MEKECFYSFASLYSIRFSQKLELTSFLHAYSYSFIYMVIKCGIWLLVSVAVNVDILLQIFVLRNIPNAGFWAVDRLT